MFDLCLCVCVCVCVCVVVCFVCMQGLNRLAVRMFEFQLKGSGFEPQFQQMLGILEQDTLATTCLLVNS